MVWNSSWGQHARFLLWTLEADAIMWLYGLYFGDEWFAVYKDQANHMFYSSAPPHFSGFLLTEGNPPSLKTRIWALVPTHLGFPGGSDGAEYACNAGDPCPIPGSGRSLGEGKGNPLQDSCLENSMDRGAWRAMARGVTESDTAEWHSLLLTTCLVRWTDAALMWSMDLSQARRCFWCLGFLCNFMKR